MLLIAMAAMVLSWLLTKRIIARWKRELEATERLLVGVCVFAAVFFIVAAFSIGGTYVYRQFARQMVSAISETADAIDDVRQLGDGSGDRSEEPALEPRGVDVPEKKRLANIEKRLAILELGGKVEVDEENPEKPIIGVQFGDADVTDDDLVLLEGLTELATLGVSGDKWKRGDFSKKELSDAGLVHLKGLAGLKELNLHSTRISGGGLVHLRGIIGLESLNLWNTSLSDSGLVHLKGMTNLQRLAMGRTQITDDGLKHVRGLTRLRFLALDAEGVSDAGLAHLEGLSDLRSLVLWGTQVSDAGLVHLEKLTSLEELNLGKTKVTGAGLHHLHGLTELTDLNLRGTKVTPDGVDKLKRALPRCTVLLNASDPEAGGRAGTGDADMEAASSKR